LLIKKITFGHDECKYCSFILKSIFIKLVPVSSKIYFSYIPVSSKMKKQLFPLRRKRGMFRFPKKEITEISEIYISAKSTLQCKVTYLGQFVNFRNFRNFKNFSNYGFEKISELQKFRK